MTRFASFLRWKALFLAAFAVGCSDSSKPYKTAPVSGVIKLDGQPLPAARVTFLPLVEDRASSQSGPEASGETDASGSTKCNAPSVTTLVHTGAQ